MDGPGRELLQAFLDHPCEATFAPLYERTKDLVYTICYRTLRSEDDAMDALQGTYGRLLAWAKNPDEAERGHDLLYVMRRLAWLESDRLRKQRSRRLQKEFAVETLPSPDQNPNEAHNRMQAREIRERLEVLVSTLPDAYRVPVVLHYFHGLTHREIAEMTGEPVPTVSSRIRRALGKLRPLARRAGLGDGALALGGVGATQALLPAPSAAVASVIFHSAEALAAQVGAGALATTLSTAAATSGSGLVIGAKAILAAAVLGGAVWVAVPYVRGPSSPTPVSAPPAAGPVETARQPGQFAAEPAGISPMSVPSSSAPEPARATPTAVAASPIPTQSADSTTTEALTDYRIEGRVYDAASGRGVGGVRFEADVSSANRPSLLRRLLPFHPTGTSGEDGTFYVESSLEPIRLRMTLPPGWLSARSDLKDGIPIQGARPGKPARVELALVAGLQVKGRVLEPDGRTPAAGALVAGCTGEVTTSERTRADAEGRFELTLRSSRKVFLQALGDAGSVSESVAVAAGSPSVEATLILQGFGLVSGRVIDPEGRGVAGCIVFVDRQSGTSAAMAGENAADAGKKKCPCEDPLIEGTERDWRLTRSPVGRGQGSVATDAGGAFELAGLAPGVIRLATRAPADSDWLDPEPLALMLAAGGVYDNVTLQLLESEYVEGRVMSKSGEPLAGAAVQGYSRDAGLQRSRNTTTDSEGRYRLGGLRLDQTVQVLRAGRSGFKESTRANVGALDSPVDFFLEPLGGLTIRVIDPQTQAPSPRFIYRLLKITWNGYDYAEGQGPRTNQTPDGTVTYSGATEQDMRFDVVELGESDRPTGRRGSAAFRFDPKAEPREIIVPLMPARSGRGEVVMDGTGQPVEGATITVERLRSWSGWQTYDLDPVFDPPPAVSDFAGKFTLTGLAPGTFALEAKKDGLRPVDSYQVTIPEEGEPEPIRIELSGGAVLHGKVIGAEGNPLPNVSISAMPYYSFGDQTVGAGATTDSEGRYRIEGLETMRYRVVAAPGDQAHPNREEFVILDVGRETELDFDYSNTVRLTGTLRIDGRTERSNIGLVLLRVDGPESHSITYRADGMYEATVPEGQYDLAVLGRTNMRSYSRRFARQSWGGIARTLDLHAPPREQTIDLDIRLAAADVYFDVAEGASLPTGVLELSQRLSVDGRVRNHLDVAPVQSNTVHFLDLPAGDYKVTYRADDGALWGESDWASLAPGRENAMVVFLKGATRTRVGGWTPDEMSEAFVTLSFDLTPAILGPGLSEVLLLYEKGVHGVAIRDVQLTRAGALIASDDHPGWTGTANFGNVYRLNVPEGAAGGPGPLALHVTLRCDGGTDSQGSVYLLQSGGKGKR